MAQIKANGFSIPKMQKIDGSAVFINDTLTVAAAPAVNDTADFLLPKGIELSFLRFYTTDMDTGTNTLAASIGYAAVDPNSSLAASASYFAAAAVFGTAAAGTTPAFIPVTFEEDVYIRITWTVVANVFAAGTIYCTIGGNMIGVR
jgi:hypothetical protein